MTAPDLLVLGLGGWHFERVRRAAEMAGLAVGRQDLRACGLGPEGVRLGTSPDLPRAVLVRSVPAGSFEQVTARLGILHALEDRGVRVVNGPRAIERCVDKAATTLRLLGASLPTPATWTAQDEEGARAVVAAEADPTRPLVLKPLFGAQGKGLVLVRGVADLPPPETVGGLYYLQRYVGGTTVFEDFRVFVVGGVAIAAMRRQGRSWITNIHQGSTPTAVPATGELADLALAATAAVDADYAGVDLIRAPEGRLLILEVNSMPAWQGLQSVTTVDVAAAIVATVTAGLGDGARSAARDGRLSRRPGDA